MKTICFFSRLELTHLYGGISKFLQNDFRIIHLVYSNAEEEIIKLEYGAGEVINFKNEIKNILSSLILDDLKLEEIDRLFIHESGGFSLNMAIRLDRSFQHLDYKDCLLLSQAYYTFWDSFIGDNKINFLLHETPAVYMTHVAANLCKKYKVFYLSQSHIPGLHKFNWIMIEGDSGNPIEWDFLKRKIENFEYSESLGFKGALDFLNNFRGSYSLLFNELNSVPQMGSGYFHFFKITGKLILRRIFDFFIEKKNKPNIDILNHYEEYQINLRIPFLIDLYNRWYDCFKLKYDELKQGDNYYYFPLHAEPEAAVLYRGDGIYESQVKLIENIAEQLPPQILLYVKDHPHRRAFPSRIYLDRLKKTPNIRIIDPIISGKLLIKFAQGVVTISGSSGFEAILLNKPVFLFGQAFYASSNRVFKIRNIRDLRSRIYDSTKSTFTDDKELFQFLSSLLAISHEGFMFYFPTHLKKININHDLNFAIVSQEIKKALNLIGSN